MARLSKPSPDMSTEPLPSAPLPGHGSGQHHLSGQAGQSSPAAGGPLYPSQIPGSPQTTAAGGGGTGPGSPAHAHHAPHAPHTPGHQMAYVGNELGVAQGDDQIEFLSEEEFRKEFLRENHLFPLLVLGICGGLAFVITAAGGLAEGGVAGAIGAGIVIVALFGVCALTGSLAAWAVGKLFAEDFGSFPTLLLRIAAVTAGEFLIFMGLAALMGPIPTIFLGLPVLLVLVIWLVGMSLLQAFVFSVILKMVEFMLISFVVLGIASS